MPDVCADKLPPQRSETITSVIGVNSWREYFKIDPDSHTLQSPIQTEKRPPNCASGISNPHALIVGNRVPNDFSVLLFWFNFCLKPLEAS